MDSPNCLQCQFHALSVVLNCFIVYFTVSSDTCIKYRFGFYTLFWWPPKERNVVAVGELPCPALPCCLHQQILAGQIFYS
jgi:hypothetical protein